MSSSTKGSGKGAKAFSEKDMEVHREYMKKYKMQSSDLGKQPMKYRDHYEILGIERDATHSEVRLAFTMVNWPQGTCDATVRERYVNLETMC